MALTHLQRSWCTFLLLYLTFQLHPSATLQTLASRNFALSYVASGQNLQSQPYCAQVGDQDVEVKVPSALHDLLPYYDPCVMVANDCMHTLAGVNKALFLALGSGGRLKERTLNYEQQVNKCALPGPASADFKATEYDSQKGV